MYNVSLYCEHILGQLSTEDEEITLCVKYVTWK